MQMACPIVVYNQNQREDLHTPCLFVGIDSGIQGAPSMTL